MPAPTLDPKSSPISGVLDLFKQVFSFIADKFNLMPSWVQIPVYLGFVWVMIYGIYSYVHPLKPTVVTVTPEVMEIHGTLTFTNGVPIPRDSVEYELSGIDVYVCKRLVNAYVNSFTFDWIMRYEKNSLETKTVFAFVKMSTGRPVCSIDLTPSELLNARDPAGDVHLEVNTLLTKIALLPQSLGPAPPSGHVSANGSSLIPSAFAQAPQHPVDLSTPLPEDSVQLLTYEFGRTRNYTAQAMIQRTLQRAPLKYMLKTALSLKKNVAGRGDSIEIFARLLAGYDSVGEFCSSGKYHDVFDQSFFIRAAKFLVSAEESKCRSMADFLCAIQDARSIIPVENIYLNGAPSTLAKLLCINVLERFSGNRDAGLKGEMKKWMGKQLGSESVKEIRDALNEAGGRF